MNNKPFNIVIVGVGGQGLITLLRVLAQAALREGFDVKTSELHGLAQRGGSVETHIRFGEKVFSPLVRQAGADLIISLEFQEATRSCYYGSIDDTVFLVNNYIIPIISDQKVAPITKSPVELRKFSKKVIFIPATQIVEKEIGNSIVTGIFMISYAVFKNLIPLRPESIIRAIKEVIPKKYFGLNKKTFYLASKYKNKNLASPEP
jgi:indolepyruvate ferredoxin oxidoreductase beta subunit